MKVKKVLKRLSSAPDRKVELNRVARALANGLSRQRLITLREFRAGLAKIHIPENSENRLYATGYVASLLDVTAEYEVFLQGLEDSQEVTRTALREDWRALLVELNSGAKLPSDLAARLGKDRPTVTRILKRMRTSGLVESFAHDSLDGRMRPHRLTIRGRNLLEQLSAEGENLTPQQPARLSRDIAQGIALAVRFFQQIGEHPDTTPEQLDAIANQMLPEKRRSSEAVRFFAAETERVGLRARSSDSAEPSAPATPGGHGGVPAGDSDSAAPQAVAAVSAPTEWKRIPAILSELAQYKDTDTPVFVRTTDDGTWGAWAYALQSDATGESRTIGKGDILAQSVTPPSRRFALVYDNPEAINADRQEPAMQAFLERATDKFVIASSEEQIPEGFIALSPRELSEEE